MLVSQIIVLLSSAFLEGWSPSYGGEAQIGRSTRGAVGFEGVLGDRIAASTLEGAEPYGDHSIAYGVLEWSAFAGLGVERPLGGDGRWQATGTFSLGYSRAVGEASIDGGKFDGEGYRWVLNAPMAALSLGLRRAYGEHWSARGELATERGFFGSVALYALPDDEKLGDGSVGESGTIAEDLELAWRFRIKLGPEWRGGRLAVHPWVAIGLNPVMTEESTIGGVPCAGDADFRHGSIGLRTSWLL